ncbi:MAG: AAA family ATPase [Methylomarinum sp.]|nr:AAA family ATPase [Methylomarinum sp.]
MKIGIFGISGAGKSFFVSKICSKNTGFIGTKASKIIAQASNKILLHELTLKQVDSNQLALINGFKYFYDKNKNKNKNIIIELHNLIETPTGIVEIDDYVIDSLNLDVACFLFIPPEIIFNQRLNDISRVRATMSICGLKELQDRSLSKFNSTFTRENIPFIKLTESNLKPFLSFVRELEVKRESSNN